MVELIIESISIMLNAAFGDGYTFYQESVEQGLSEPCFFIQSIKAACNLFHDRRYYCENKLCIQYFPLSELEPKAECETVAFKLYEVMEWLTFHDDGTQVMGKELHHEIEDGVLSFFVDYDFFLLKVPEQTNMETLKVKQRSKEDQSNGS